MFDRVGQVIYPAGAADVDAMFEAALDRVLDNVESDENGHEITCATEDYNSVSEALFTTFGAPEEAGLVWKPQNTIEVNEAQASTLIKLLDVLDDNDDVQSIASISIYPTTSWPSWPEEAAPDAYSWH